MKDVRVIFLTASSDRDTVTKAGLIGVQGYIKKPFMPKDLIERVSQALASKGTTESVSPRLCRIFFRLSSSNPSRRSDATPSRRDMPLACHVHSQSKKSLDRATI